MGQVWSGRWISWSSLQEMQASTLVLASKQMDGKQNSLLKHYTPLCMRTSYNTPSTLNDFTFTVVHYQTLSDKGVNYIRYYLSAGTLPHLSILITNRTFQLSCTLYWPYHPHALSFSMNIPAFPKWNIIHNDLNTFKKCGIVHIHIQYLNINMDLNCGNINCQTNFSFIYREHSLLLKLYYDWKTMLSISSGGEKLWIVYLCISSIIRPLREEMTAF